MDNFKTYKKNITSQWGEDGIIEELFRRIGTKEKFCIEFGAWDGKHLSNVWNLWHENDWSALLIEAGEEKIEELTTTLASFPKVKPYLAFVEPSGENSLDEILEKTFPKKEIDLLSIDIDGDDYYIFESLRVRPRVIVVEYNPTIPVDIDLIQKFGQYFGSSALALHKLANKKNYRLITITETNMFFVRDDEFLKLGTSEPNLKDIFIDDNLTYIMTGYDGTPAVSRIPTYHDLIRKTKKELLFKKGNYETVNIQKYNAISEVGIATKIIKKLYLKTKSKVEKVVGKREKDLEEVQEHRKVLWNKVSGDKTLRMNYPLSELSVVVDVGGFEGQWASDIFAKYCCKIFIFEPIEEFAKQIEERFKNNKNITCYTVGLSNKNGETNISLIGDQSSFIKEGSNTQKIKIVDTSEFLSRNNIEYIDLMKINIEGEEYNLLENVIKSGFIKKIKNIQVQFHDFVPDAKNRMTKLYTELSKTHHPTYQYEFVWENWERNK